MKVMNIKENLFIANVNNTFVFIESLPFSVFCVDELQEIAQEYWNNQNSDLAEKIYSCLKTQEVISCYGKDFCTIDENYLTFLYIWSTRCNLGCPHCLAGKGDYGLKHSDMSMETFTKALNAQENRLRKCAESGRYDSIEIGGYFFGGEPLMNAENLIRALGEYENLRCRLKEDYPNIEFTFSSSISTNGTLLTPEMVKIFKKHNVEIILSIDGPDHDVARPYKSGKESLPDVLRALDMLLENGNHIRINTVILPNQMPMIAKRVKWFENILKGAKNVRVTYSFERGAVGQENGPLGCKYNPDCIEAYKKEVGQYIEDGFDTYETELLRKISVGGTSHKCSAGLERICIVPSGEIYPCQSFIDPKFLMGNINESENDFFNSEIAEMFKARHIDSLDPCKSCYLKSICNVSFDCASHSRYDLGDFYAVDQETCKAGYEVQSAILEKIITLQFE